MPRTNTNAPSSHKMLSSKHWQTLQKLIKRKGKLYSAIAASTLTLGGLVHGSAKQLMHEVNTIVELGEQLDANVVTTFLSKVHKKVMQHVQDENDAQQMHRAYTNDHKELMRRLRKRKQERDDEAFERKLQDDEQARSSGDNTVKTFMNKQLQPLLKTSTQDATLYGKLLKRAFRRLHAHTPNEMLSVRLYFLTYHIIMRLPNAFVLEFLKGGHAHFYDDGKLYTKLATIEGSHQRFSSHYPQFKTTPHLGLTVRVPTLPVFHVLGGIVRRTAEHKVVTWVQLESSPMPSLWRLFHDEGITRNIAGLYGHLRDYLAHRRTRKQYGPLGTSYFTEKHSSDTDVPNVIKIMHKSTS